MDELQNRKAPATNPYLIEDLERRLSTDDLSQWMELESARLAVLGCGTTGAVQFNRALLHDRNISSIRPTKEVHSGKIDAVDGAFVIYHKNDLPAHRTRFIIAHEIGHTCWFASDSSCDPLSPIQRTFGGDSTIELLCNAFASMLLIPTERLINAVGTYGNSGRSYPPIHAFPQLARHFNVSESLIAQRLLAAAIATGFALACIRPPTDQLSLFATTDSWRLSWCVIPASDSVRTERNACVSRHTIVRNKYIPKKHVPHVTGDDVLEHELGDWWWRVIALAAGRVPNEIGSPQANHPVFATASSDNIYLAIPV